jgi:hypothetical protein
MFIRWSVFPSSGEITDGFIANLPFAPFERHGNFIVYVSPIWDADIQQYVDEYVTKFVDNRINFEEAANCFCRHSMEMHVGAHNGNFSLSNNFLRNFINMQGDINFVNP